MNSKRTPKSAAKPDGEKSPALGAPERFEQINTAAFYKACAREFSPGREVDDWLAAEAEYDARFDAKA